MNRNSALLAVCFLAGLLGALANSMVAWLAGHWGLTAMVGVNLAPALTTAWLYPRLVWGGLWGLLLYPFVARPRNRCHWVRKGLWLSLLPTAFQLFYLFPQQTSFGLFGYGLGTFTPAVVLFFNFVWGFFTGLLTRLFWGRG